RRPPGLGNSSITRTSRSHFRQAIAADNPAGPAPTIMTSRICITAFSEFCICSWHFVRVVCGIERSWLDPATFDDHPFLNGCDTGPYTGGAIDGETAFETMTYVTVNTTRTTAFFVDAQFANAIC